MWIMCRFHKTLVQLTVELQYNFRGVFPPFCGMILHYPWICPCPIIIFFLLCGTSLMCTNIAHGGIHPLQAAIDDFTAMYSIATTIPPFQLLQVYYTSTILWIQYNNSTVIILHNSAGAFDDSDCAEGHQSIRRDPLTIPRKSFDDSADYLQITHTTNVWILKSFWWHVPYVHMYYMYLYACMHMYAHISA